jgi:hypothetical protein
MLVVSAATERDLVIDTARVRSFAPTRAHGGLVAASAGGRQGREREVGVDRSVRPTASVRGVTLTPCRTR